ncbi:flavin oxidoreductase [Seongchinamella unica]|uniref:Flavin oxidoreductase n=1 Tax=Seongchinamella unica TaxID=2547392 RepID=A0A4R5LRB9_9GAMM|nr:flavin reductase [Seongchinamella unica]TDG13391.1 flavin oxidoreductase [Seongchinamella unica]
MKVTSDNLQAMPDRQRAALVNSLSGFKSANLVGTVSSEGRCNLAIMSSAVHLGSNPALLGLVIRPGGDERHTLANILASGCYSLNHVSADIVAQSHQTAARYDRDTSEFEATGLTPQWWPDFKAPLVAEARVKMAMRLREHLPLEINGTHFLIGEILALELPDASMGEDGSVDLATADSVALSGLDRYHTVRLHKRMAYAKPDLPPREIG